MADELFYTIATDVGKAKIANAVIYGTKVNITQMAVGDSNGSYYEPTSSQEALVNEVWRGSIQSLDVDPDNENWLVVKLDIPGNVGGFTVREAAVFDDAGDMIAIGKYPASFKPIVANGGVKDLYIKLIIEVSNTSVVNLKIDPAVVTATKEELAAVSQVLTDTLSEHLADTVQHVGSIIYAYKNLGGGL